MAIPAETHFIPAMAGLKGDPDEQRAQFLHLVTTFNTWTDFHLDEETFAVALRTIVPFDPAAALRLFYRLCAARSGKRRWGDKTPLYGNHQPFIRSLLPESRFIHIIRDGRDVALSVRPLWFAPGGSLRAIAADWRDTLTCMREAGRTLGGYLEVRYEHLLRDPEHVLQEVCRFIELDFHSAMLTYHRTAAERLGEMGDYRRETGEWVPRQERLRWHACTNRPPDPNRSGRWTREMTPEERSEFSSEAGRLLAALGYPP